MLSFESFTNSYNHTPSKALGTASGSQSGADVGHRLSLRQLEQRALPGGQVGDISRARQL